MTTSVAGTFFRQVLCAAEAAEQAAGAVRERWYRIGGLALRARLIGRSLESYLTRALGHLERPPGFASADLTLRCWDCAALGVEFPGAPVAKSAFTPRGEIRSLNDERFHAAFEPGGRQLSLMDTLEGQAIFCVGDSAGIPRFERAEPIRAILSWLMRRHGRQLIHAAAVGRASGGVLLLGRSGAGKSNTALGCLTSDLLYASDDFCAVAPGPEPRVYSLYSAGKTREADWARHPFLAHLAPDLDPLGLDKAIYFLNETCGEKLAAEFPLRAILLPRRGGERCELRPASPAAALRLAAPDTSVLLPDAGAEVMRCLAALVRTTPCHELVLGPEPARIAQVIGDLLARPPVDAA